MSVALRLAPLSTSCTEHELVARVRRGEDHAFEQLYTRYRKRVAAYVLGMVGDHGRAEDITQDVFISALRRMRDTERPIAFKPWIYEIAKNACIDSSRRTRRGQEVSLELEDDPSGGGSWRFGAPTLEIAVEAKQQLDDLCGAFGCLSESHHKILVLRELEGLSYQEIGERMGMSRPMVESTLFRARRRLGEEYEELVSGRRCLHVQAVVSDQDARSLGLRERRRLARHLAHCQPCRRQAKLAGFDDTALKPTSLAGKIAALLPFPLLRVRAAWRGRGQPRDVDTVSRWQSPVAMRSADALTRLADPAAGSITLGRAAAAVAAAAIAGAGGGLLSPHAGPAPSTGSAAHLAPAHLSGSGAAPLSAASGAGKPTRAASAAARAAANAAGAPTPRLLSSTSGRVTAAGRPPESDRPGNPHPLGKTPAEGALTAAGSALDGGHSPPGGIPGVSVPGSISLPAPSLNPPRVPPLPKLNPASLSAPRLPALDGAAGLLAHHRH